VAFSNQKQARRQKREDNFFSSLEWLTGKSQRRNVGIAAVEFFWGADEGPKDQIERFKSLSIDALSNTAMYLLLESDQGFAVHESNNLRRVMTFLLSVTQEEAKRHALQYEDLNSALQEAQNRRKDDLESAEKEVEKETQKRGTSGGEPERLQQKMWIVLQKNWRKNRGIWIEPECLVTWQEDLKPLLLTDSTGRSRGTVDLAKQ